LANEKARRPRDKKRPLSKGPRRRRGPTNHGNGKKFEKGQNSHDGTVFRRGPDTIPRGSGLLMLRTVMLDKRQAIYDSLCDLVMTPRGAHEFIKDFTDRTDGKAVQRIEKHVRRTTSFAAAPPVPSTAITEAEAETIWPGGERMVQL
jgi:hypothetical protein